MISRWFQRNLSDNTEVNNKIARREWLEEWEMVIAKIIITSNSAEVEVAGGLDEQKHRRPRKEYDEGGRGVQITAIINDIHQSTGGWHGGRA